MKKIVIKDNLGFDLTSTEIISLKVAFRAGIVGIAMFQIKSSKVLKW